MSIRTDLALACREMFAGELSGVESENRDEDGISVTHVTITTQEGAQKIGKPIGNYITIEISDMNFEDDEICERGAKAVAAELKKLGNIKDETKVLVVGLGNQYITPDSIGPKTAGRIFVTRHLQEVKIEHFDFDFRPVSAVAPGVLGLTGIETGEIVLGIVEKTKPDLVIAVDALASRKLSRLGTTVQIADTGINPGSGVGNNRKEISEKTLGVPVIAIGVPMVVDAATMADDLLGIVQEYISRQSDGKLPGIFDNLDENEREALISEALSEINMIVTPKNVDIISNQAARIISEGINAALHD